MRVLVLRRTLLIITLITAGEMVFGLPFLLTRFFRPTMLEVFSYSNTQLGDLFFFYGVAAMLAYYPGGAIADHFSARLMLTASLFATAIGGLFMATFPGETQMKLLFAYWGVTTIFLFWGALIRATRDWGGARSQGMAFGLLDGGRGLTAALVAASIVALFASMMPDAVEQVSDEQRRTAFTAVILAFSGMTAFAGLLTWAFIPVPADEIRPQRTPLKGMLIVLRRPIVWAQAAVIVCAYCGYKGLDNYSIYAEQVLGMHEVDAARFATWGAWVRPVAAISAGLIADRLHAAKTIAASFGLMLVTFLALSSLLPAQSLLWLVYVNIFVSYFAVFALRGVYFALLEDNRTPIKLTGATVGMVSFIGYTPDVFFGPVTGRILDANPGIVGFHNYFMFLAAVSIAGIILAIVLVRMQRQSADKLWPSEIIAPDDGSRLPMA